MKVPLGTWGLLFLAVGVHPEARPLSFAYFGPIDPRLAGVNFLPPAKGTIKTSDRMALAGLPDNLAPGWYAVSVNHLYGSPYFVHDGHGGREWVDRPYYFRRFEPVATAGHSIYIYHLTDADIKSVRELQHRAEIDSFRNNSATSNAGKFSAGRIPGGQCSLDRYVTGYKYMQLSRDWSRLVSQRPEGLSSQRQAFKALAAVAHADEPRAVEGKGAARGAFASNLLPSTHRAISAHNPLVCDTRVAKLMGRGDARHPRCGNLLKTIR